jgi:hypothetical protein
MTSTVKKGKAKVVTVLDADGKISTTAVQEFFNEVIANIVSSNKGNKAAGRRVRVNLTEFKAIASQLRVGSKTSKAVAA